MAESSVLFTTDGTGDGINSGYTQSQIHEIFRALFAGIHATNLGGVVPDYLNELAVTGIATPVAVNTGAAIVYGLFYSNSASVNVAVATPSVSTRIDAIVLRASYAAQTIRITKIDGVEGGSAPALTQSAGVTWDIPLATVSITTGGVITVTDAREWVSLLGDGMVTTAKIGASQITNALMADDAIDSAEIADGAIDLIHMSANSVDSDQYVDGSIDLVHMSANSVDSDQYVDGSIDPIHIGTFNIDDLDDVVATTPSDGHVLTWDSGTSKWVNEALAASFSDAEGDPANVTTAAADGTSAYAARRDHAHTYADQSIKYNHLDYGYSPPTLLLTPSGNFDFTTLAVIDTFISHADYDSANIFSVASGVVTCTVAALLEISISGYCILASGAGPDFAAIVLQKNAGDVAKTIRSFRVDATAGAFATSIILACAANDQFRVEIARSSGSDTLRLTNEALWTMKALCKTS